jgi:cellulose synthase/poly-beta-1,6-N-acetylglucosamine synthase-like glycosyltransferase
MILVEALFWLSILLIVYAYVGYPLATVLLSLFVRKEVQRADIEPMVSLLITAYNEEKDMAAKIENCLALDYPEDKLEIVVASDGSTDATDDIVRGYETNEAGVRVVLHRVEGRLGKTAAQNSAVRICRGEVVVFSDAASMYDRNAIRALVRNYADPKVGAVSGMYTYINKGETVAGFGTILFWKFENFIKKRQSMVRTITGCCGCIYSVRKNLYTDLPPQIISDLVEPLTILRKGYRIVFEPEALALEETAGGTEDEMQMRVRVILRGMNGMLFVRDLFDPRRHGFVSFQLISHKLLRWLVSVFAVVAFAANAVLAPTSTVYLLLFVGQALFYLSAAAGYVLEKLGVKIKALSPPLYFCTVNMAALISLVKLMRKENIVTWQTIR